MNPKVNNLNLQSLLGAKKSIIISYSHPWVFVFSTFNNPISPKTWHILKKYLKFVYFFI